MRGSIHDLRLTVRTTRILEDHGVRTINALLTRTPYDLLTWYGFGLGSLRDVRRALEDRGLTLKDDPGPDEVWEWYTKKERK